MPFKRLSRFVFATAGAVMLTAGSAGAHTGHTFTFTASSYAANANANYTSSFIIGAYEGSEMTIDLPAGFKLAHDDQYGNELSSNPADDTQIGSGTARAAWIFSFCSTSNVSLTVYFEEDMTGAPANAVAHYRVVAASVGTYDTWAIEENDATDDYKLWTDLNETWTCSTQPSDSKIDLTINGTAGGNKVSENPGTAGCYTVTATVKDVANVNHSGSDSKAFAGGSC